MVEDFWALDQTKMTKENIISKVKQHYAEEFIDNYEKWKDHLDETNNNIYLNIAHVVPKEQYVGLTFDELCGGIVSRIENYINTKGIFTQQDIRSIIDSVYYDTMNKEVNNWNNKKNTLHSFIKSIKKVVASVNIEETLPNNGIQ